MKLIRILIDSNIYISLAAVFLTLETQIQLGMQPQWHPYLFLIFFSTLFEYNLHRLITILTNKKALEDKKHQWVLRYPKLFYLLVGLSTLGFLIAAAFATKEVIIALAPCAVITIFYSLPIFKKPKYLFRLRDIPFLKIFLISFIWAFVTIMLPVIQSGYSYGKDHIILMLAERSIFVFAITIPFDIRDIQADKFDGLKTIPILIGVHNSIKASNLLMLVFTFVCLVHYIHHHDIFILSALLLSAGSTCYFINSEKMQQRRYYHYGILDGTMLLQGILVYTGYCIDRMMSSAHIICF